MKLRIATVSMISILIAMGLGRFTLTPQLPHMLAEGQISLTQASLLAAANFLGYLVGAVETIGARNNLVRRLKMGLWGNVIILFLSALISVKAQGFYLHLLLRFLAGVASAWVLVLISTWLAQQLAQEHALRAFAFAGVGIGIFVTGIIALVLDVCHASAAFNWMVFGFAALILTILIYKDLPSSFAEIPVSERLHLTLNEHRLTISYALCGIGYVLPATFLSKLAKDQFSQMPLLADAFWPLFGLAVMVGMALLASQKKIKSPSKLLSLIFLIQGFGILACTYLHGIFGLLLGALLVGGSFMVILQLTMRLGSELAPQHVRAMTAVLTTAFAIGQFIGPLLSALSTHLSNSMTPALILAAAGSFFAAFLVLEIVL